MKKKKCVPSFCRYGVGVVAFPYYRMSLNKLIGMGLVICLAVVTGATALRAQDADQITAAAVAGKHLKFTHVSPAAVKKGAASTTLPGISGIDSVPNFSGTYSTPGIDPNGNPQSTWFFNTLGNPPSTGTTTVGGPIVPVSIDLRNADGTPRYVKVVNGKASTCGNASQAGCQRLFFDPTPFIEPVLESPVFSNFNYTSSRVPTQFADAVARAEYQGAKSTWHTLLAPSVKTMRTMVINQDPTCGTASGNGGTCNYQYALNADGSCCFFVLLNVNTFQNELFPSTSTFPPDSSTPVGAAEASGNITTKDVSTFFFPPAYLFIPTAKGSVCCIGGFHTFDFESGDANNGNVPRAFVLNYSTWDQPIFRDPTVLDVTGLSHEISETYNDPFVTFDGVHDVTPWWLAPNGLCQDNLEVGDVIEGLPGQTFPITMPNGFTYHPQNEALLQWFEFQSPSTALNQAYSYPDITTLTALSAPQKANCAP
jgi:hypothetical protein